MQTGCHGAYVGSRLKRLRPPGRRHLKCQPSSRTGENPPYGMIGGIEETSASFEARYAPRSYPTDRLITAPCGAPDAPMWDHDGVRAVPDYVIAHRRRAITSSELRANRHALNETDALLLVIAEHVL